MNILKTFYFISDYSLQFLMWLVVGRLASQVLINKPENVILQLFVRFTEPFYQLAQKTFPFLRMSEEKKATAWGRIDGWTAVFLIATTYFLLRPLLRIMVSVIIVNLSPSAN